jgi:ABC-2 type transport system permease protein
MTSATALIADREIRQRMRTKGFAISTVLIVVLVLGIGILTRALSGSSDTSSVDVAVVGTVPTAFDQVLLQAGRANGRAVDVVPEPDRAAAESALRSGDVDAVLLVADRALVFHEEVDDTAQRVVDAAWQTAAGATAAQQLGLSPEQTARIVAPAPLRSTTLESNHDDAVGILVGIITAVVLFAAVSAFGGLVLTGVVEEKTSAIVELLLARVTARQLLAGKVTGIGTVALVQLTAAVAAGVIALAVSGTSIPSGVWIAVPTTILWFLGGFALFSTLYALAGSFVSRQEDAQAAALPVTLCVMAAYLTVFPLSANADSTVAVVLSMIPPWTPLLMPLRIATGSASWWQVAVGVALLVLTTVVVLRLAASIYSRTLLQRGRRISWRQALHLRSAAT